MSEDGLSRLIPKNSEHGFSTSGKRDLKNTMQQCAGTTYDVGRNEKIKCWMSILLWKWKKN